jgi:hypothetical protein
MKNHKFVLSYRLYLLQLLPSSQPLPTFPIIDAYACIVAVAPSNIAMPVIASKIALVFMLSDSPLVIACCMEFLCSSALESMLSCIPRHNADNMRYLENICHCMQDCAQCRILP